MWWCGITRGWVERVGIAGMANSRCAWCGIADAEVDDGVGLPPDGLRGGAVAVNDIVDRG